ncbi:MAG: hypothetical protein V3V13_01885 [Paracoccaceae bacterium]
MNRKSFLAVTILTAAVVSASIYVVQHQNQNLYYQQSTDPIIYGHPLHRYIGAYVHENFNHLVKKEKIPLRDIRFNRKENIHKLLQGQRSVFSDPWKSLETAAFYKSLESSSIKSLTHYMAEGRKPAWFFNAELALRGNFPRGEENTDQEETGLSEVTAFLPGMSEHFCKTFGRRKIPKLRSEQGRFYQSKMINDGVDDYAAPNEPVQYLDIQDDSIGGEGCFESYDGREFVYFYVLQNR